MSDLDRLATDLGRAFGSEAIPSIELERDPDRRRAQLGDLRERLASVPAALVSVRQRSLDGAAGADEGWEIDAFEQELESAGLSVGWLGLTDAHGSVGRRAGLTALLGGTQSELAADLLSAGPLGLRFDPAARPTQTSGRARVCIASYEFVGPTRTGGVGTAYTSLAQALAADGHEVVVLFTGEQEPGDDPLSRWASQYRKLGIELHGLAAEPATVLEGVHRHLARAYQVYEWLRDAEREQPFDVIHFPEVLAHGYFTVLAKHQDVAFQNTTLVTGTHSSTSWVLETNGTLMQAPEDYIDDFSERRTVEGADVVVSPSAYMLDWMRSKGWPLARRHFVQQYVRSAAAAELARSAAEKSDEPQGAASELVFFGRLEPRKGLHIFCDAVDGLAAEGDGPEQVTFLGKAATIDGMPADEYIELRSERWPWPTEVISDLNQPQAIAYLMGSQGRLTVIPSLADNSPNTVYEALALGIPFIASRVGGTAELIDARDLDRATFDPGDQGDHRSRAVAATELARRLRAALGADRLDPPRAAVAADACRESHLDWHRALAGTARAAGAGAAADRREISVFVIGTDPQLIERTRASLSPQHEIHEAPSHADATSSGAFRLYVSAGIELDRDAPERLASALAASGAAVTAPALLKTGKETSIQLPAGGPPLAGLFRRCFGDAAFMIASPVLERVGGFDPSVAPEVQAHVLLSRVAVNGLAIDAFPEVLGRVASDSLPSAELVTPARRVPALLDAYAAAPAEILRPLPLLCQQLSTIEGAYEQAYLHLYRNRFGRFTGRVRFVVHKVRRLQALWRRILRR